MAENIASANANVNVNGNEEEFLTMVETLKEKNERIEQLEKTVNAKDMVIKALQNALFAKDKLNKFLKQKIREFGKSRVDGDHGNDKDKSKDKDSEDGDAETGNENVRKTLKAESDQINQHQNSSSIDSDSDTWIQMEAAIKVARIPLILNMVLKSMQNRDLLKNCRLVCREWRDLSTSILLKRTTFQIYFNRPEAWEKFFEVLLCSNSDETGDFDLILPKTFPCAHFIFDGNLKSDDAQEFLDRFGNRVKGIKLIRAQDLNFIKKLFLEQIPLVESLELERFVAEGNSNSISKIFPQDSLVPVPQLSSLRSLKLGKENSPELVKEILNSAPNLEGCFGMRWVEEIECLHQRQRLGIVKGLKLKSGEDVGLGGLQKFLHMIISLTHISDQLHLTYLDVNYTKFDYINYQPAIHEVSCSLTSKLLRSRQTTLKRLKFTPDPNSERLVEWSTLVMEKMEKLTLDGDLTRNFVHLFPPAEVLKIFPKLYTIHLKIIKALTATELTAFENHPPIFTVKNLIISGADAQMMRVFAPLFPNVTSLCVKSPRGASRVDSFPNWAPIIWQVMRGLKNLQMELNCPAAEMDAAFTGMEIDTCKLIRFLGGGEFQMEEIDKFRVNPSILNLTELEALFLPHGFTEDETPKYDADDDEFTKATFISFKYAFKLMPKLRVFPHANI